MPLRFEVLQYFENRGVLLGRADQNWGDVGEWLKRLKGKLEITGSEDWEGAILFKRYIILEILMVVGRLLRKSCCVRDSFLQPAVWEKGGHCGGRRIMDTGKQGFSTKIKRLSGGGPLQLASGSTAPQRGDLPPHTHLCFFPPHFCALVSLFLFLHNTP